MSLKLQVITGIVQNRTLNEKKSKIFLPFAEFGLGIDAKKARMVASELNIHLFRYLKQKKPPSVKQRTAVLIF